MSDNPSPDVRRSALNDHTLQGRIVGALIGLGVLWGVINGVPWPSRKEVDQRLHVQDVELTRLRERLYRQETQLRELDKRIHDNYLDLTRVQERQQQVMEKLGIRQRDAR